MTDRRSTLESQSQGKIHTENKNLAALLRENSKDAKENINKETILNDEQKISNEQKVMNENANELEKVYVDWPETDDDEEYRFVSSRVDEYEKVKDKKKDSDQGRTYILRDQSANAQERSAAPPVVDSSPVHVRISSGNRLNDENILEEEADYQRKLQQRIEENSLNDAQLEIPRLDLDVLRESSQGFVADSLDVISVRSPNPPKDISNPTEESQNFERDSLDVDNEGLPDSLEFNPKLNSTFNQAERNGNQDFVAIDSSRDPPPRETIVRPPPYGKEETQRTTEMEKYNRGKYDGQPYHYGVKSEERPAPQGQQRYDQQDRDRWEDVNQQKEVSWAPAHQRASPVPYGSRVEYEAREPIRNDAPEPPNRYETYDAPPRPQPDFRYDNYERERAPVDQYRQEPHKNQYNRGPPVEQYQAPPRDQYETDRGPPQQGGQYREPQQDYPQEVPLLEPPRQPPPQRHYDYVDRRVPPQQEPYRELEYQQESHPLPEKRAHFQNDSHAQQVAYEQQNRQGQYSQRPPTPYQEESSRDLEQYKGVPPVDNRGSHPQGSAQSELSIYNDESESEPSAVNLRSQNVLERDLEELYQSRKGKPRRQLQNDEQYSQMLQDRTGGNTDRSPPEESGAKKPPAKSPTKASNTDYIETNKQTYGKGPKRTYGKMHEKRKEDASPKRMPKNVSNSAGALSDPEIDNVDVQKPTKPASAEEVWSRRAKRLQEKTSGKGKKTAPKNERGPLRKYPSESSVPNSGKQHVPHLLPIENGRHEPHVMAPYQPGTTVEARPVQAVWSDDGQRVSLDINLKLVSPAPNSNTKVPLPPVGQSSESASNVGSAIHVDRIYDYPYADPYSLDQMTPREQVDQYLNTSGHYNTQVNPYKALPPIPQDNMEDSYVAQYHQQKQAARVGAQYKPYSLHDYKRMQKEVKLGGLGPDLDNETHKEKLEKKMRQQEYARQIHIKNVQEHQQLKKKAPPPPRQEEANPFTPNLSKRSLALDYSKQVQRGQKQSPSPVQAPVKKKKGGNLPPKPPTRFNPTQQGNNYNTTASSSRPLTQMPQGTPPLPGMTPAKHRNANIKANQPELIDLTKLLQQHQRDKENVSAIRQNLGGGPSLESKV